MSEHKIPWDELSGESNLKGKYKISFELDVKEDDKVTIETLHEVIASGFAGNAVLNKISRLDLEKAEPKPTFKVGDRVRIKDLIEVEAELEDYGGHLIVGWKGDSAGMESHKLGTIKVQIPKDIVATVNDISGDELELTDFQQPFNVLLKNEQTGELEDTLFNIDSIIFSNKYIERVEE